jgi:hypothetical protein
MPRRSLEEIVQLTEDAANKGSDLSRTIQGGLKRSSEQLWKAGLCRGLLSSEIDALERNGNQGEQDKFVCGREGEKGRKGGRKRGRTKKKKEGWGHEHFLKVVQRRKVHLSGLLNEGGRTVQRRITGERVWVPISIFLSPAPSYTHYPLAASDWTTVGVLKNAEFHPHKVRGCVLEGSIVFGNYAGTIEVDGGVSLSCGIYHSTLKNVSVDSGSLVSKVNLLANAAVRCSAVVSGSGFVGGTATTSFGNGLVLPVGVEQGGRYIPCCADTLFFDACTIALKKTDRALTERHEKAVKAYAKQLEGCTVVVESGAKILNCPRVENSYVGPHAILESSEVVESTVLSFKEDPAVVKGGSSVHESLLQPGTEVEQMSIVNSSFMCEHSHMERHGKLIDSLLGPNSGVAEGEITSCLVGPFVGFHHQALLIATTWPSGKGNIGYGANVGSNHTGKAPDQEHWGGEGLFYGLAASIKFPCNYVAAPYSLIATGINCLPQKVEMPFSLIMGAGDTIDGISPAFNEINPAWTLSDALFAMMRNEMKFKTRNKARNTSIPFEIFRPHIVEMMKEARKRLSAVGPEDATIKKPDGTPVFTDKVVKGIGKNYMTDKSRVKAISTYTFYVRYYALRGLYQRLTGAKNVSVSNLDSDLKIRSDPAEFVKYQQGCNDPFPHEADADEQWTHQVSVLQDEFPGASVADLLKELLLAQAQVAKDTEGSKSRDDKRGNATIPDYSFTHKSAAGEPIVVSMNALLSEMNSFVGTVTAKL